MQVGLRKCALDLGNKISQDLVAIGAFKSCSGTAHGGTYILAKDGRVAYVPNGSTSAQRVASTSVRISHLSGVLRCSGFHVIVSVYVCKA
jgi:hypothetical protein